MDFSTAIKTCFGKYVTFSGRAERPEFWYWVLFSIIGSIVTSIIDAVLFGAGGLGLLNPLFALATFLPSLAVSVRRLHDLDKSGWWYLLVFIPIVGWIILIVWYASAGTNGDNRFGPKPSAAMGFSPSSIPPTSGDLDA